MPTIRPSQPEDMAAITAIYQHHVLHGTGTFEIEPPTLAEMTARREDVLSKGLPYLVLEDKGKVMGFAYCNWFKPRPAYRFSAEDSIYLAKDTAGKGWGRMLLAELSQVDRRDRRLWQCRFYWRAQIFGISTRRHCVRLRMEIRALARHCHDGKSFGCRTVPASCLMS
jgi:L-amino acid N-acyltransferase YncA